MCLASCPIEFATRTHAIIARRTASGSAWPANPTETRIENATAAAGAMCVIDWKRTSGSPIECSRRRSKCWGGGAERASMFLLGCEAAIEARGRARVKGCLGTNRPCRGRSGGSRGLLARDRCLQRARLLDADCVTLLLREGDRLLKRRGRLLDARARILQAAGHRLELRLREEGRRHRLAVAVRAGADFLTAANRFFDGRGAAPHRQRDPRERLEQLALVAGRGGVAGRALPRVLGGAEVAQRQVEQAKERPRLGKATLLVLRLEDRDRPRRLALGCLGPALGVGEKLRPEGKQGALRLQARVARSGGRRTRLLDDLLHAGEVARLEEREGEIREQADAERVVHGRERDRALEQVGGGGHVAAREGLAAGCPERNGGAAAELDVGRPHLGAQTVRLLEVVAEDLLELAGAVARHLLDPADEALVQLRPLALRD